MRLAGRSFAPLLFLLLAVFALALSVFRPFYNWDMIGYIAAAKSYEERNPESLHSFTYGQLRRLVPDAKYQELVQGSYRQAISTDSAAFSEQLPFYRIRPVYTGLVYLLYKAGFDIGFATHLVSGVAVALAVAFLYFMSLAFLKRPLIYAVPPLAVVFGVLDLARYSTPDGLAFLAVILSAFLYMKRRIALLLTLLPIMLGIRTDLILFTIPLLFLVFALERGHRWTAALSIIVSAAVYVGIGSYWRNPGWSTVVYCTLVQPLTHPISMPPTLTVQDYFHALVSGTRGVVYNKALILYALGAAYWLRLITNKAKTTSAAVALKSTSVVPALVSLFFVISHFFAFPVAWDRFFSAQYLIGTFSLLVMVTDYVEESKPVAGQRPR